MFICCFRQSSESILEAEPEPFSEFFGVDPNPGHPVDILAA